MLTLLTAAAALAGERTLPWTYAADTEEKDEVEVEHYLTLETPLASGHALHDWENQLEVEYGITRRLEAGLYVVANQEDGGPLTFGGYKARLQYRMGPMSGGLVDPAVYLEYVETPALAEHEIEGKIILSKDNDHVSAALNLTGEAWVGEEDEFVFEPTGGATFAVTPRVWVGGEGKLEEAFTAAGAAGPFVWAGPCVHLLGNRPDADGDHDEAGGGLSWTVGGLVGLTHDTREDASVEVRSLFAVEL